MFNNKDNVSALLLSCYNSSSTSGPETTWRERQNTDFFGFSFSNCNNNSLQIYINIYITSEKLTSMDI